MKINNKSIHTL